MTTYKIDKGLGHTFNVYRETTTRTEWVGTIVGWDMSKLFVSMLEDVDKENNKVENKE